MTTVIEKPMLFSGPMVRAILEGRKTQTRRIVKFHPGPSRRNAEGYNTVTDHAIVRVPWTPASILTLIKCPHPVGSHIWVRETWQAVPVYYDDYNGGNDAGYPYPEIPKEKPSNAWISYAADGDEGPWRPAIHMPRWASRITLEVTDVRVQRLQEITKQDVIAEGIEGLEDVHAGWHQPFAALWNSINGPDAWEQNPWVWAYTFRRLEGDHD